MEELKAAQAKLAAQLLQPTSHSPSPPRQRTPPPLPPRKESTTSANAPSQPLKERGRAKTIHEHVQMGDPRSSSMQSLRPRERELESGRRSLLLIFIHGFMGNETSFQSFPAHLHHLLTYSLADSHTVHSKIYPRYKSRRPIEFARDDFSRWLEPHESPNTDVVLLGHSMGGLLAAEVALMPPKDPNSGGQLRHRIVGTINFDTPFLGMHPGIVSSGIASLFRSTPPPPTQQTAHAGSSTDNISMMTPGTPSTMNGGSDYVSQAPSLSSASSIVGNDPNFNTPFPNDVHIVERKGFDKFMHFAKKHADDFTSASKQYFVSHIEFGGCMADFPGLKKRYKRIRELEDVDNMTEEAIEAEKRRVRFVNYYTASTGIPKSPKLKNISVKGSDGKMRPLEQNISELNLSGTKSGESERRSSGTPTPRISLEEHREGEVIPKPIDEPPEETETHLPDVKNRIENLGASSGVRRQSEDVSDTEMAPMRMVDAAPLMSDDDYPSGSEYHSAREDDDRRMSSEFTQPSLKPGPINFPMPTGLPPPPLLAKPELSPIAEKLPATPSAESQDAPKIITTAPTEPALPILPPEPIEPESFIPEDFPDKDSRKAAEKEHKRSVKTYQQALKDREKAIKEREKAIAKREKKAADEAEKLRKAEEKAKAKEEKERQKLHKSKPKTHDEMEKERLAAEKERMEAEGRRLRGEPEPESMSNTLTTSQNDGARSPSPTPSSNASSDPPHSSLIPPPPLIEPKKKKEHHFCLLPADLSRQRPKKVDPCWVRVYMEGVDEVGAHCGLFFQGPQYESLVGDVGDRIKGWIESEATRRVVEEFRWLD